jgi:Phosphoesterase family
MEAVPASTDPEQLAAPRPRSARTSPPRRHVRRGHSARSGLSTGGAVVVGLVVVVLAAILLLVFLVPSPISYVSKPGNPAPTTLGVNSTIKHVVVIVLENQRLAAVDQGAQYERYLQSTYGNVTNFYGACHESLPEYDAMTSGQSFTCTNIPIENATNIADLVQAKGGTWGAYFEGMPSACDLNTTGPNVDEPGETAGTTTAYNGSYTSYHNPFITYADVRNNATRCDSDVLNSEAFNETVAAGVLPTYSYYVPNIYNDGLKTNVSFASTWLQGFLGSILNSTDPSIQSLVASTAWFIVSDEGSDLDLSGYEAGNVVSPWCEYETGQALSVCGGATYLAVVSPLSHGTTYTVDSTDYSLLSTVEYVLGLGSTGEGNDGTAAFPAMTSLFS